jgi:uncharacterized low-complexity protein
MSKMTKLTPIVGAVATLLAAPLASATDNPFGLRQLPEGYMLAEAPASTSHEQHHNHHNHHHKHHHHSHAKAQGKTKEGVCAATHRKMMEGKCGTPPAAAAAKSDK